MPGYDLRRRIQAKDPLCCANAFFVQIRTILATVAGIRMCAACPHCSDQPSPCQDALGSNAELVGGFAGRADALFGAVEAQKPTGSLHLHFKFFVQRLHQYSTLKEIADLIERGMASLQKFKQYVSNICTEVYPHAARYEQEANEIEANWPRYDENCDESTDGRRAWGRLRLGLSLIHI